MLIRTYMEELREYTNDVLYENWRTEKLLGMGVAQDSSVFQPINPAARMQEERVMHEAKLAKMEAEMKMVFQQKVQEKEAKLKQSEEELYARHKEMKDALEKQRVELEEKKRRIEAGRPITPEGKGAVRDVLRPVRQCLIVFVFTDRQEKGILEDIKDSAIAGFCFVGGVPDFSLLIFCSFMLHTFGFEPTYSRFADNPLYCSLPFSTIFSSNMSRGIGCGGVFQGLLMTIYHFLRLFPFS